MIFLLTYPGVFAIATLLYYCSNRFNSWIVLQSSSARVYQRFLYINKGFLISFGIASAIMICQEIYLYHISSASIGDIIISVIIACSIAGLIVLFGRYLRSRSVNFPQKHKFDGFRFLLLLFWSTTECALVLICLLISILALIFGFGHFDGID